MARAHPTLEELRAGPPYRLAAEVPFGGLPTWLREQAFRFTPYHVGFVAVSVAALLRLAVATEGLDPTRWPVLVGVGAAAAALVAALFPMLLQGLRSAQSARARLLGAWLAAVLAWVGLDVATLDPIFAAGATFQALSGVYVLLVASALGSLSGREVYVFGEGQGFQVYERAPEDWADGIARQLSELEL